MTYQTEKFYNELGINLRDNLHQAIGQQLFAERRRRGKTLSVIAAKTNINPKIIDKTEVGTGKFHWIATAILLKYYHKQIQITLIDTPEE